MTPRRRFVLITVVLGFVLALGTSSGQAPRRGQPFLPERFAEFTPGSVRFAADTEGVILASVFSLPSQLVDRSEAREFLEAVRTVVPDRQILVLSDLDPPEGLSQGGSTIWIPTQDGPYSLWPRDPFSLVWRSDGGIEVLLRPNKQRGREKDSNLGLELVGGLPPALDRQWGGARWSRSPIPFHNGQVLLEHDRAWISIHTLEPWLLERLGLPHVPVSSFDNREGIAGYVVEARRAASELAELYGRQVRFIHPLPESEPLAEQSELMDHLGGGSGFDLDSLVTLLPQAKGETAALVADISDSAVLARSIPIEEWAAFRDGFRLWPEARDLAQQIAENQGSLRSQSLNRFLDVVARHLSQEGLRVERLPLLLIPTSLLEERVFAHPDFILGWNNVVVEEAGGGPRAEGFGSLLSSADRQMEKRFRDFGVVLDLVPPLTTSLVLNGGYRCASNHLRSIPKRTTP